MSIGAAIGARVAAQAGGTFRLVGAAADLERVREAPRAVPALYVVPLARDAAPSSLANAVRQHVAVSYGLVIVAHALTDSTGGGATADVEALSDIAIGTLLGWTPAGAVAPIQYGGGQLVDSRAGHVWWQDVVTTARMYSA